jgi:hypothetical protein
LQKVLTNDSLLQGKDNVLQKDILLKDTQKDILLKDNQSHQTEQNDSLLNPSAIGDNALHNVENEITKSKVLGFRIQAKGRRGARSSKQVVEYGKLSFGNVNSKIDFGQSSFTTKRGSTGVKVYVCYE